MATTALILAIAPGIQLNRIAVAFDACSGFVQAKLDCGLAKTGILHSRIVTFCKT
jgi:hypothetical protein